MATQHEMEMEYQGDLFLFGNTQCAHCGALIPRNDAMVHVYYTDQGQVEEHFCPDRLQPEQSCHIKWYLKRLQEAGL